MRDVIIHEIQTLLQTKDIVLVAVDGRCASGKTSLAKMLSTVFDCNVFHMDDFFLRPEQRTAERLSEAGGNVDRERFLAEVLLPLSHGEPFSYRPYDCSTQQLSAPTLIMPKKLNVIEGSYSCHPELIGFYDLRIFLTVSADEQMHRIQKRNGADMAEIFRTRWIPMEEQYFSAFSICETCDMVFET